jgi:hypothetical protein
MLRARGEPANWARKNTVQTGATENHLFPFESMFEELAN